jgi:hypothetical protein
MNKTKLSYGVLHGDLNLLLQNSKLVFESRPFNFIQPFVIPAKAMLHQTILT